MSWYLKVLKNYANFSGRAQRKEYWYFNLLSLIIAGVLGVVDAAMGNPAVTENGVGPIGMIYILLTMLPAIAVTVRRLHDISRSGWWILIGLVPLIGIIVLIIFAAQDSDPNENEYGQNPKLATGVAG